MSLSCKWAERLFWQATEWYREDLVGQALLQSSVPREEVFLTSKLHPRCGRLCAPEAACCMAGEERPSAPPAWSPLHEH